MILNQDGKIVAGKKPRPMKCSHCEQVLIEGSGIESGFDFVKCPACLYYELIKKGMRPETMIQHDIVRKKETDEWALGFTTSIKGFPDTEMVITEKQLSAFLEQIKELKEIQKSDDTKKE